MKSILKFELGEVDLTFKKVLKRLKNNFLHKL